MQRPSKLNTVTTGAEPFTRAVSTTWLGVERSSSNPIRMPASLRWRNMAKMS